MLDHYEMWHVQARLERGPLTRRVMLSGPADDFQRREIKRMVEAQPGVGEAAWSPASLETEAARCAPLRSRPMIPLFVEAALMALTGFAVGLLVAYLVALRRRRQY